MKKLMIGTVMVFVSMAASASGFIHPMDFNGSEAQKQQAIRYIEQRVRATYCDGQLDMCQPTMLRMMERENLSAFKKMTQASDRSIMDEMIRTYCNGAIDMCDYTTLWMMYKENEKASKETLDW
jgi:hypothetical protein